VTAAKRVARGAALLDEKRPGWAAEIDLRKLDLASGRDCPLGQLWTAKLAGPPFRTDDAYMLGLEDLGIYGDSDEYGFNRSEENWSTWAELDELWIAEIRRRTETAGAR